MRMESTSPSLQKLGLVDSIIVEAGKLEVRVMLFKRLGYG